jgi:excinuclease ABC subunit B
VLNYDLEMMRELGYCSGIENYSRYFDQREPASGRSACWTIFPEDFLMVIDESHVTVSQDRRHVRRRPQPQEEPRGVRLPPAQRHGQPAAEIRGVRGMMGQTIFVSATPADFELQRSEGVVVEQVVRPTGLLDPPIEVRPSKDQIDDLLYEIRQRRRKNACW